MHFKKSLRSIVVKKMYTKMSSVHGSSVLTVKQIILVLNCYFAISYSH